MKQTNAEAVARGFTQPWDGSYFHAAGDALEDIAKEIKALTIPVPDIPKPEQGDPSERVTLRPDAAE